MAGLQQKGDRETVHGRTEGVLHAPKAEVELGAPLRKKFAIASTASTTAAVKLQVREKPKRPPSVQRRDTFQPPVVEGPPPSRSGDCSKAGERYNSADSRALAERSGDEVQLSMRMSLKVDMTFGSEGEEPGQDSPERHGGRSSAQGDEEGREDPPPPLGWGEGSGLKLDDTELSLKDRRVDSLRSLEFGEQGSGKESVEGGMEWGSDRHGSVHSGIQSICDPTEVLQSPTEPRHVSDAQVHVGKAEPSPKMGSGRSSNTGGERGGSASEGMQGSDRNVSEVEQEGCGAAADQVTLTQSPDQVTLTQSPSRSEGELHVLDHTSLAAHPITLCTPSPPEPLQQDASSCKDQSDDSSSDTSGESPDFWPKSCILSHVWPLSQSSATPLATPLVGTVPPLLIPGQNSSAQEGCTLLSSSVKDVVSNNVAIVSKDVQCIKGSGSASDLQEGPEPKSGADVLTGEGRRASLEVSVVGKGQQDEPNQVVDVLQNGSFSENDQMEDNIPLGDDLSENIQPIDSQREIFCAPDLDDFPNDGLQAGGPPDDGPPDDGPPDDGPPDDGPLCDGPLCDGPPDDGPPTEGSPDNGSQGDEDDCFQSVGSLGDGPPDPTDGPPDPTDGPPDPTDGPPDPTDGPPDLTEGPPDPTDGPTGNVPHKGGYCLTAGGGRGVPSNDFQGDGFSQEDGPSNAEGGDIMGARDEGGDIMGARDEGEDIMGARDEGGDIMGARDEGGDIMGARDEGGDIMGARDEGGDIMGARDEGGDIMGARDEGGDIMGARPTEGQQVETSWSLVDKAIATNDFAVSYISDY